MQLVSALASRRWKSLSAIEENTVGTQDLQKRPVGVSVIELLDLDLDGTVVSAHVVDKEADVIVERATHGSFGSLDGKALLLPSLLVKQDEVG